MRNNSQFSLSTEFLLMALTGIWSNYRVPPMSVYTTYTLRLPTIVGGHIHLLGVGTYLFTSLAILILRSVNLYFTVDHFCSIETHLLDEMRWRCKQNNFSPVGRPSFWNIHLHTGSSQRQVTLPSSTPRGKSKTCTSISNTGALVVTVPTRGTLEDQSSSVLPIPIQLTPS